MEITKVFQFLNKENSRYYIVEIDDNKKKLKNLQGEVDLIVENSSEYIALIDYLINESWIIVYEYYELGCKRVQLIKRDFLNGCFYKLDIFNSFFHEKKNQLYVLDEASEPQVEVIENRNYLKGRGLYVVYLLKILIEEKKDKIIKIVNLPVDDLFLKEEIAFLYKNYTIENLDNLLFEIEKKGFVKKVKVSPSSLPFIKLINAFQRYVFLKNIPMIGFIGLDGSGKSTLISNICDSLNNQDFACSIVYLGHKEYELNFLKKINNKQSKNILDTFMYTILWPVEVRFRIHKAIKTSNFILFDRHPNYEPIVPKGAKYFILNICYLILSKILVSSPNFIFFLTGDNQTLWARKKEDTFASYENRVANLKEIIENNKVKTEIIRTDIAVEDSLLNIKTRIIEYFKNIK